MPEHGLGPINGSSPQHAELMPQRHSLSLVCHLLVRVNRNLLHEPAYR